MKTIPSLLVAAIVAASAASATPVFAMPGGTTGILTCSSGVNQRFIGQAKRDLAVELQLSTKRASSIDEWNGCFKVQYTDDTGHTVVELYDPDSLSRVNVLN